MIIVAWRGGIEAGRENSVEAIRESVKYAEIIEIDVRRTKDDILVLSHDRKINSYVIREHTYEQLLRVSEIATLEEALEVITKNNTAMLDVKDKRIENLVLSSIENFDRDKIVINSLQPDVLLSFRKADKNVKMSVGLSKNVKSVAYVDRLIKKIKPWCATPHKANKRIMRYLAENYRRIKIIPWLIKERGELSNLPKCHGIVTPYPRALRAALRNSGASCFKYKC